MEWCRCVGTWRKRALRRALWSEPRLPPNCVWSYDEEEDEENEEDEAGVTERTRSGSASTAMACARDMSTHWSAWTTLHEGGTVNIMEGGTRARAWEWARGGHLEVATDRG